MTEEIVVGSRISPVLSSSTTVKLLESGRNGSLLLGVTPDAGFKHYVC